MICHRTKFFPVTSKIVTQGSRTGTYVVGDCHNLLLEVTFHIHRDEGASRLGILHRKETSVPVLSRPSLLKPITETKSNLIT